MNYKVTFYKDYVELLTERKANFVNKIRRFSSEILHLIANKNQSKNKTIAQKLLSFIGTDTSFQVKYNKLNIIFVIDFIKDDKENFSIKGKTTINSNKKLPTFINLIIHANNKQISFQHIINQFHKVISHELSHVFELDFEGDENYTSSTIDAKHVLKYFTNEKEMRAHCMEIATLSKTNTVQQAWEEIINTYLPSIPKCISNFLLYLHASYTKSTKPLKNRYYDNLLSKITNEDLIQDYESMKHKFQLFINEL